MEIKKREAGKATGIAIKTAVAMNTAFLLERNNQGMGTNMNNTIAKKYINVLQPDGEQCRRYPVVYT